MTMTQQEFINTVPKYSFGISIADNQTMEEKIIGHSTNDLDEIIYEFGDLVES
jgi:hypothetical protein